MTFDEIMKQALGETIDERLEQMLAVTPKPKFSLSYRIWERKTLKNLSKNRYDSSWTLRKTRHVVTVVIIAMIAVFMLTACSVGIMMFGRFSLKPINDYLELYIAGMSSDKTRLEEYYGLSDEDGWEIEYIHKHKDQTSISVAYERDCKNVTIHQQLITDPMGYGNPETEYEPTTVYDKNDGFFISFDDGDIGLYWVQYGYFFSMYGNLDKDELLNLAHSIKIIDI